jgi:peptidyl-prolyl cis-trans isomerase B (cyclophilin B)
VARRRAGADLSIDAVELAAQAADMDPVRANPPNEWNVSFLDKTGKLTDNAFLDHTDKGQGWGYAVFGKVVSGMEAVDAIVGVPTTNFGPMGDVPVDTILIKSAQIK